MALRIDNHRAETLIKEISALTGESATEIVVKALEERWESLQPARKAPNLVEEIMAISRRCSQLPDLDPRSSEEILEDLW